MSRKWEPNKTKKGLKDQTYLDSFTQPQRSYQILLFFKKDKITNLGFTFKGKHLARQKNQAPACHSICLYCKVTKSCRAFRSSHGTQMQNIQMRILPSSAQSSAQLKLSLSSIFAVRPPSAIRNPPSGKV